MSTLGRGTIFRQHPPHCKCAAEEILLYLVFVFDYNTSVLSLRAIDRTREKAETHLEAVKREAHSEGNRVKCWIDTSLSDHAFAASMYQFNGRREVPR